jgi:cytochrome c553
MHKLALRSTLVPHEWGIAVLDKPSRMMKTGRIAEPRMAQARQGWWRHSLWFWVSIALAVLVLALITRSAAAQTERGTEIIERALAAQPDPRAGARIFRDRCASCHGTQAHGSADPVTPSLAGQQALYLIKQMVDFAEADRSNPEMHRLVALKDLSTPQSLRDVSSYLNALPGNAHAETGDGKDLAAGKRYYDGLCAYCHGKRGEGNEQHATPALQRQHYSYLLLQSRRLAAGHRYSVPSEVMDVLQSVPFDTLMAIADYASRLPQQAAMGPAAAKASRR